MSMENSLIQLANVGIEQGELSGKEGGKVWYCGVHDGAFMFALSIQQTLWAQLGASVDYL